MKLDLENSKIEMGDSETEANKVEVWVAAQRTVEFLKDKVLRECKLFENPTKKSRVFCFTE